MTGLSRASGTASQHFPVPEPIKRPNRSAGVHSPPTLHPLPPFLIGP